MTSKHQQSNPHKYTAL